MNAQFNVLLAIYDQILEFTDSDLSDSNYLSAYSNFNGAFLMYRMLFQHNSDAHDYLIVLSSELNELYRDYSFDKERLHAELFAFRARFIKFAELFLGLESKQFELDAA